MVAQVANKVDEILLGDQKLHHAASVKCYIHLKGYLNQDSFHELIINHSDKVHVNWQCL